jgi:hypothetical protein
MIRLICRNALVLFVFFILPGSSILVPRIAAQEPAAQPTTRPSGSGWLWVEQFSGSSSNGAGQVMSLASTTGYNFSSHFGLLGGIPVYFIRDSSSTTGATSSNGMGDVFAGLRFSFANPIVNYRTTLVGTAPTGDTAKGLSTGHATFDWTNHFDRRFGRWIPFANLGLATSVPDTLFYQRQYTSYGYIAHFQAGASFRIFRPLSAAASAYDIEPWGTQEVVSRIVGVGVPAPLMPLLSGPIFEQSHLTTGGASLTRDNGVSAGLDAHFWSFCDVWAGYSHSMPLNLNTVSFGLGVNVMGALRHANE